MFPLSDRVHKWVKPKKSNDPGGFGPELPFGGGCFGGRANRTSLVFSGWSVRPYLRNRSGSTSITRRASPLRENTNTASSA